MSKSSRSKKQTYRRDLGIQLRNRGATGHGGETPSIRKGQRSKLKAVRKRSRKVLGWF
jgi:hypothetical protein